MAKSPSFRTITLALAANEERTFNASGTILTVLSADGAFEIAFDDDSYFEAEAGLGFEPIDLNAQRQTFKALRFHDTSGVANSIRVQIGTGIIHDNRSTFGNSQVAVKTAPGVALAVEAAGGGALPVTQTDALLPTSKAPAHFFGQFSGTVPTGWTLISAANANRKTLIVSNEGTESVNIGDGTNKGIHLGPGEAVTLETQADVHIWNAYSIAVLIRAIATFN